MTEQFDNQIETFNHSEPVADHSASSVKIREYDSRSSQTFNFETTDDQGTYAFSHTFGPLAGREDLLIAFDNERSIDYASKGKTTEITPSSAGAAMNLWKALAIAVAGYGDEGEPLPENWKDLVPAEDKVAAIAELLFVEIVEEGNAGNPEQRRRSWGSSVSTKTIKLLAYFDGREVEVSHNLKAKTAEDVMAYDRIKSGVRIHKTGMQLKPHMKQKGELYDKMIRSAEGYAGDSVPLHHKALVITAVFDQEAVSTTKKSNS
jgi:hypothetical protein